jgi:GTPase SAR1 family protein
MLAEAPLEARSRLGLALFALGRLADEVGVQPSPAATVNSLVAGLKDPFLFVVAGEVNAGKSMLLNGLFGEEFCPTSALPTTDKIRYFRHGFARQEISFSPEIQEIRVPLPFLQDFHIVDTPGVNSVAEGHEAITEQFLPRADAVLFVLPVTNPWGARCWEFLARIHTQLGKRIVLVLSQIDLRSEMEVAAIEEHLQLCLRKYLGRELPVFPVSAKQALISRTSGVGKHELLAQSRFQPLEAYLNQILTETNTRVEKLSNTLRMGKIILGHIQTRLGEKSTRLTTLGDALRRIGHDVQQQKERTWTSCLQVLPRLGQALAEATAGSLELWTRAAATALEAHSQRLRSGVGQDFLHLWRQTRVTMDVALGTRVAEPATLEPSLNTLRAAHTEILTPLREGAAWEEKLDPLRQTGMRNRMICWAFVVLGSLALGGGIWLENTPLWLGGALVIALSLWLVWWGRRSLQRKLQAAGIALAQEETHRFTAAAEAAIQAWLPTAFQTFSSNYRPLLDICEKTRLQQETHQKEAESMRANFDSLARQLGTIA